MDQLKILGKTFGKGESHRLISTTGHLSDSLPAVELGVDTLTAVVRDYDTQPRCLAAGGKMLVAGGLPMVSRSTALRLDQIVKYGDEVFYHHNDEVLGKFYLETAKRTGRYEYQLSALSAIGLLLTSYHYGGLYSGETVAEVLEDIIGGIVPYTLDETLGKNKVYGLLRKAIRRDNLRDLLFSTGGQIRKDSFGSIHIIGATAGTPYEISSEEFYMGGDVDGGNPATEIRVTEHAFIALPGDTVTTLFEGEAPGDEIITPKGRSARGTLVDFDEPMHDLNVEGATILESGVNYAVLSESSSVVLTGKQYTHTQRTLTRKQSKSGNVPNVVSSSGCELVNQFNSETVADRLWAYYSAAKTIETEIVVTNQRPGDAVTFVDPFGDKTEGYISDMELTMSAVMKARATLIAGYVPPSSGNYYSQMVAITESGTFVVPDDAKSKIRVVLISGGHGGSSGHRGETLDFTVTTTMDSHWDNWYKEATPPEPSEGGAPGDPGLGARIKQVTLTVSPGQSFRVVIGKGGAGGLFADGENSPGTPGEDSSFGEHSTADAQESATGFYDSISGVLYGAPGGDGIPGGKGGGKIKSATIFDETGVVDGESVTGFGETFVGGTSFGSVIVEEQSGSKLNGSKCNWYWGYLGSFGGGAAYGAKGADGAKVGSAYVSGSSIRVINSPGGKGADAAKPPAPSLRGTGGYGGNGGGGAGAQGAARIGVNNKSEAEISPDAGFTVASPTPGKGSDGGDGASGIVLIYY